MIFVVGSNGQLGQSLVNLGVTALEFDITNSEEVEIKLKSIPANSVLINAAAYTKVDMAEVESDRAYEVNSYAVENLAVTCKKYSINLIHISTDYVFDGEANTPYTEKSITNPKSIYGKTKLLSEKLLASFQNIIIVRTSWVYSEFGNNFLKTMLKLKDKENISVVFDQVGTPTYAVDLASVLIIIANNFTNLKNNIYHYSNEGVCSWYDFAKEIFDLINSSIKVNPILSAEYPTKAERPKYSVLDKSKIKNNLKIQIPYWKESLKICLKNIS